MSKQKSKPSHEQPNAHPVVPIVAVGASAGGIDAFSQLLANLSPTTGLAFVYIQHLDTGYDSHLIDILSQKTSMRVVEADHLLPIEPNQVYVIPTGKDLEVIDGVLTLVTHPKSHLPARSGMHMPIDQFFIKLADQQKNAAIAVILSGTATDGTLGLRAIKVAGGITFAQDETAQFQGMPKSAISEGVVDWVLPPAQIAKELEALSQQMTVFQQPELTEPDDDSENGAESITTIIQLLRRSVGVDFSHYKITTIRRRIIRRMLLLKLETLREYTPYLEQNPEEVQLLYNDLLINVTTFFRDHETMDYLKKVLFARILADRNPRQPLRIWIPACSTGQEAYSLAMILLEVLGDRSSGIGIQIFATDLSEQAVAKARLGSYTRGEVMDVSPKRLQRFFTKIDDHYRINRNVRDLCVFAQHNVLKDPPFSRVDLISCRNLLIYLDNVFQRKAISLFHYALNPSGILLLGKSETIGNATNLFAPVSKNYKVFLRKNDAASRTTFDMGVRQGFDRQTEPSQSTVSAELPAYPSKFSLANDLDRVVDTLLLQQYVPASVVVNADLDILQFRGSTGLFLEPAHGKASLNLLKMARPSLAFELRNLIHKVRKTREPVRKEGLNVKIRSKTHYVAIEAVPLRTDAEEQLFLILFEETVPTVSTGTSSTDAGNLRIRQLEEELATMREDMRSIIEEQDSSNEELQLANEEIISSNEELQSINEELETSKEEIESTNEELLTINQELQVRNDQLSEAIEFSEAIFSTIREATLVLDKDLRVRSANKTFYKLFRTTEDDTEGRLIYELGNRQWNIPQLRMLLTDVLMQDNQIEGFEVVHSFPEIGEKVLLLNARRVIRQQESILLAIEDITDHRQAQQLLAEREAWLHTLIDNAPAMIWVTNAQGQYTFFNKAWQDFTGRPLDKALKLGWEQLIHPDDRASYLTTASAASATYEPFQMEFRIRRHDGEYRWLLMNAKPTFATSDPNASPEADGSAREFFNGYIGTGSEIYNRRTLIQALDLYAHERTRRVIEASATLEHTRSRVAQTEPGSAEQKQAQEELRQSEEQLQALIESTPDVIMRWDNHRRLIAANSALTKKTGVPLKTLLGKTNVEMGQPNEIALPYMDSLRQVIETGKPKNHFHSFLTPTGLAYYYSRLVPELGPDGSVQSVLAIARDVTELKLVEEIQQTANNLQAVLNSSPAAIGMFRAVRNAHYKVVDFHLIACNQKFADFVRQQIIELVGQSVTRLGQSLWQDKTVDELTQALSSAEPIYREQYDEPNNRWLGISMTKSEDGVVVTGLDITALREAEQKLDHLFQEVERSSQNVQSLEAVRQQLRQRGEFLRTTTHDLRGSFGVIQGAASLLSITDTEKERSHMLAMLHRNLRQATQMLTQLLDYSRLEAGQEELLISEFDAADMLCEMSKSVQPLADEKGLTIKTEGPKQLMVQGDAVKVQRITQNLVLNALKYTQAGHVTISWQTAEGGWQLGVSDTGPGLSPDLIGMFTNDEAGHLSRPDAGPQLPKDRDSGEGIGLFIVKRLVELLNARLSVDSQPEKGTHFQIFFPAISS
ncbi:PAS domain-containing protein [Spirosoma taeanense]|uniref:PAS domain-containing protein n=1 Tax=Spirosoma taeanense TaxID=2735870 RepID=A0A6M5Y599_9BACT|nr:CheR family methyltransferase [Spirosoma taeanense]QJW89648.1 PAS domain-containing protein [Spirosoma taeanense]